MKHLISVAVLLTLLAGCGGGGGGGGGNAPAQPDERGAISAMFAACTTSFEAKDISGFMRHFSLAYLDGGYSYNNVYNDFDLLFNTPDTIVYEFEMTLLEVAFWTWGGYAVASVDFSGYIKATNTETGEWTIESLGKLGSGGDILRKEERGWVFYGNQEP